MHLLVIAIVMLIVAYVLMSFLVKRPKIKPAALEDWEFPQFDEGTPQAVPFGDVWQDGAQITWYGNYRTKKITAGGKK